MPRAVFGDECSKITSRDRQGAIEVAQVRSRSLTVADRLLHRDQTEACAGSGAAVGAAADVSNKDQNTRLTPLELQRVNSLQLRLKTVLDQLGANIVWDHTKVKNRRLLGHVSIGRAWPFGRLDFFH